MGADDMPATLPGLSVSVVAYKPEIGILRETLTSLSNAILFAKDSRSLGSVSLYLIDNDTCGGACDYSTLVKNIEFYETRLHFFSGHGNVGYGRGHNLAIMQSSMDYHLVLNPDVSIQQDALLRAIEFMQANPRVGLMSPTSVGKDGRTEYLCKRYPSILDLVLRGFAPAWMKNIFDARLARYEFRTETDVGLPYEAEITSGCFMFARLNLLRMLGGFSDAFFMYFEDFDLSLRVSNHSVVMHVPSVRIRHFGGGAAKKGLRHVWMFLSSAIVFFRRNGLKLF